MVGSEVRVLSIGCSCINRFQFDFFADRHPELSGSFPRGLFDWNIASLEATFRVLELAAESKLLSVLQDPGQFHVAWETLIFNGALPGFSFFHESDPKGLLLSPERSAAFLGKLAHLAQPFITSQPNARTHLVWSNLQPNLPDTVENVIPWKDFVLTEARYIRVKDLGRKLFGSATTFSFLSTPTDMSSELGGQNDVIVVPLPRNDSYEGDPLLYESILTNVFDIQRT